MDEKELVIPYGMTKEIKVSFPEKDHSATFKILAIGAVLSLVSLTGYYFYLIVKHGILGK
jgi:hypothetical protein